METTKTHWTQVDLAVACGRGEYDVKRGDNAERRALMAEYRDTGAIEGAFLADLDTLNRAAKRGDETADLGPRVDEIDWTGL